MSNKTRYFVLTAGAILAVGLTTGLVASYMGLPVAFSRAAGPDELQYVPADAAVVAYANVRDVLNSDFRERFRKFEPDTTERDEFQQKTGVNIEEDIHTVVAALMPGAVDGQDWNHDKGVLIIARGRFEQARLEALALEHGGNVEDYQGKRLITHVKDSGEPDMAVGFLDADLIALGGYTAIKKSIDASTGKNVISNTEMMRRDQRPRHQQRVGRRALRRNCQRWSHSRRSSFTHAGHSVVLGRRARQWRRQRNLQGRGARRCLSAEPARHAARLRGARQDAG